MALLLHAQLNIHFHQNILASGIRARVRQRRVCLMDFLLLTHSHFDSSQVGFTKIKARLSRWEVLCVGRPVLWQRVRRACVKVAAMLSASLLNPDVGETAANVANLTLLSRGRWQRAGNGSARFLVTHITISPCSCCSCSSIYIHLELQLT